MELIQNALAKIVIKFTGAGYTKTYKGKLLYTHNKNFGVSLGKYIIISHNAGSQTLSHEYGHCLQSEKLGILYLLVVGLPSITMNIMTRMGILEPENYYKRFPENWADKLGGVRR